MSHGPSHRTPISPHGGRIAALAARLRQQDVGIEPITDPVELERLSSDHHDYSPILRERLRGHRAELAVKAVRPEQVLAVAAACADLKVPLTLRGAGTGNYGQCVPMQGGLVLDLTGLRRLREVDSRSGIFVAEAGCTLARLDEQLAAHGRSLRLVPSTYRSATLGGFVAGGSGGIGSLRWGFLKDPGHLLGLEVVTVEPHPRRLQLDASASASLNHAYGTNGIITALRMASTELVPWWQVVIGFPSWQTCLAAAEELPATGLLLNSLCVLEGAIAAEMPWPPGCPPPEPGEQRLLLLAAADALPVLPQWLGNRGGELIWKSPQEGHRGLPIREISWNHTTLHWRSRRPDWTYLQMLLPAPAAALPDSIRREWGQDVLWHLEGVRQGGAARLAALPLLRWRGEEALHSLIGRCRELGAVIFDPHRITVEDGGLGGIDADQVAAKADYDPGGLLNPGKLRGWLSRSRG